MTKNNRGGFRPGSGRKPKPETEKYKKYMIVLRPDQIAWLNENILQSKAAFIRAAIDKAIAETKETKPMTVSDGAIKIWQLLIDEPNYNIWTGSEDNAVHDLIAELHEHELIEYHNGVEVKTMERTMIEYEFEFEEMEDKTRIKTTLVWRLEKNPPFPNIDRQLLIVPFDSYYGTLVIRGRWNHELNSYEKFENGVWEPIRIICWAPWPKVPPLKKLD